MILGLTGFSGAGKSTVAALLKEQGFYHLDCDWVVHNEVYQDPAVLDALEAVFPGVLKDGALDRPALRNCTMGNPDALKKLNDTVMPFILARIQSKLKKHRDSDIILDAPLLFESGLDRQCDKVLSVVSNRDTALQRITLRDGLSPADAEKRLSSQKPASFYTERSHYIIHNDQGLRELESKTLEILKELYGQTL